MNVLIMLYQGFTEYEAEIPFLAFDHYQIPFELIGLDRTEIMGMAGFNISVSKTLDNINPLDYDTLFLPGIDWKLREQVLGHQLLLQLIRDFDRQEKIIAAVCGAPVLLGAAGVLAGRRVCSNIQKNDHFKDGIRESRSVVQDGHIITGLGSRIFHLTALVLENLAGKDTARDYREWAGIV